MLSPLQKILVAGDSLSRRVMNSRHLRKWDYDVLEASDGLEALSIFRRESPSIVVTGLDMPEIDGFRPIEAIRKSEIFRTLPRAALLLAEGKTAEAAREYHKLKGMLSCLAGKVESDLARRAEVEARQGSLSPSGDTVIKLERFLDAFGRFLRERGKPGE